jgi:hypothetical protein
MPYSHRVLIVDDRPEDGEAIARRLWQDQVPNCFIKYDENILGSINNTFNGIRVIFQDIKLVPGTGIPDHGDYGAAAQLLDSLLKDNNGPWLLVAWSTWGEDPDNGQRYAAALFEYLIERLPVGKKPYQYLVIDKKPYTVDSNHGEMKSEGGLSDPEKQKLLDDIRGIYKRTPSIDALGQWERYVGGCASDVVNNLWQMTEGLKKGRADELAGLLLKLAKSQDGRVGDDISDALYAILSSLLSDRLAYINSDSIELGKIDYSGDPSQINTMLHWDGVKYENANASGALYYFPLDGDITKYYFEPKPEGEKEFIYNHFIRSNGDNGKSISEADKDNNFNENIKLVLLDVTPPCDHDNGKAIWRKMVVGINVLKNEATGKYLKHVNYEASLKKTPVFCINDREEFYIFNSRLISALPDQVEVLNEFTYIGRLREQLLRDFISWLAGMITRPGVVEVR